MLSQVSYIGSTLKPNDEIIATLENVILNFLFPGRNNFPKERVFLNTKLGGLGIPDIRTYLLSLRIKTASRAYRSAQPWALYIKQFFPLQKLYFISQTTPNAIIENSLVDALNQFNMSYFNHPQRIWSVNLFYSKTFFCQDTGGPITPPMHTHEIANFTHLKLRDIVNLDTHRLMSYGQVLEKTNVNFNFNLYYKMYCAFAHLRQNFTVPSKLPPVFSLGYIFNKNVKASFYRSILEKKDFNIVTTTGFIKYENICPSPFNMKQSRMFYSSWNLSFLPNCIRNFALKMANGKIQLNSQLANYVELTHPYCTWCFDYPLINMPHETIEHFFFECRFTLSILLPYFSNLFAEQELNVKNIIFKGHIAENNFEVVYINLDVIMLLYYIFRTKFYKRRLILNSALLSVSIVKKQMMNNSPYYRKVINWIKNNKTGNVTNHLSILDRLP